MSAQKKRSTSVAGAILGFVGFSALAGLLVTIGVTPALAVGGVTASNSIGIFNSLPEYISIGQLQQRNVLYGKAGGKSVPFATLFSQNRVNLKWNDVSDNLKKAAVDGEDRRFYEHGGVDLTSIVRAGFGTISGGSLGAGGGGSTLTMQLVKNIRLAQAQDEKNATKRAALEKDATDTSITRKLQEMKLAIGLEKKYSKDEILLAYLNIAYFGDQAYGVEAASEHYFDKSAKDLTVVEAASLMAIVQYPTTRNLASPKNYDANVARRNVILQSMHQLGDISDKDYQASTAEKPAKYVKLTPPTQGCAAVTYLGAQQFCDYVKNSVGTFAFLGSNAKERQANWSTGGYKVYTTINLDLTGQAKERFATYAPKTESRFALGSVVDSVEPSTGRVVVMAQNKDYTQSATASASGPATSLNYSVDEAYGSSAGFQTGSSYKPFTLIDWLQKGHGLSEQVNATKRGFETMTTCGVTGPATDGAGPYSPQNDEVNLGGYMNILTATAESVNVAFVAMAQELDLCDIRKTAESLGVHRADGKTLGDTPSSVLGVNEIAPLTMASAYAAIANNGKYCSPIIVDKAIGPNGKDLGGQPKDCKQAIPADVAAATVFALKNVMTYGTAVGALPADGTQIFGKTGTTDGAKQIWLIGSSTSLTTAIWMGNTNGSASLRQYYGPTGASYAQSRAAFFQSVQTVNDTVYPGGAFPAMDPKFYSGSSSVTVPDVVGSTTAAAQTTISGAGFTYVDGGTEPGAGTAGTVSRTVPAAGASIAKGGSVTVYTSDGSQSAALPDVTGAQLKDATADLQSAGFDTSKVAVKYTAGDDGDRCKVVSSDPASGTSAAKNAAITLTVSGTKEAKDPGNCQ